MKVAHSKAKTTATHKSCVQFDTNVNETMLGIECYVS